MKAAPEFLIPNSSSLHARMRSLAAKASAQLHTPQNKYITHHFEMHHEIARGKKFLPHEMVAGMNKVQ